MLLAVSAETVDHDLHYVAALRQQSFYRLSEVQCERLLSRSDLDSDQRVRVVVELSKTMAAQALNSRPPQRDVFWQRAENVLGAELSRQQGASQKVLLQSQMAFVIEQRAEWTVREAEIRSRTDDDWAESRAQLRYAIKQLKIVERDLSSPQIRRELSTFQLLDVKRNVTYQLGRAYLHQAIAYGNSSQDKTNALTQALSNLEPIASDRENDALAWKSRVDRIRCVRMLGQLKEARSLISDLDDAPDEYIGQVAAEAIRLAVDAKQLESAMALAQNAQLDQASPHPDFQLARIEAIVATAEQLKGQPKAKVFQDSAAAIAANLSRQHGVYWSLRGEILLSHMAARDGGANTGLLNRAAETMLRQDDPEKAKGMFVRAAEQADRVGDSKAFDFLYKAAIIDHREGKLQSAIDQFRAAAGKHQEHAKAPEAHLLAVYDAAALYQQQPSTTAATALKQYETLLAEHIEAWPTSETADQARMWSAKLAAAKRDWRLAIELYRGVQAGSKLEIAAFSELSKSYEKWYAVTRPTDQELLAEREWFDSRQSKLPPGVTRSMLAIQAARLAMLGSKKDYAFAERVLLESRTNLPAELRQEFSAILIVAFAGNDSVAQAQVELTKVLPLPVGPLLTIIRGLAPVRERIGNDVALHMMTSEVLQRLQVHQTQIGPVDRLIIQQAVADYSNTTDSLSTYKTLALEHPDDVRIQRRYAELLSAANDPQSRKTALKQWRKVVRQSAKRSTEWFRGKLGVAQAHFELGEREKAKELIEYLQAIYPDLGGQDLKRRFEMLLASCR